MMSSSNNHNFIIDFEPWVERLFQGSWHAARPNMLRLHGINSVICIGFKPDKLLSDIEYQFIDIDDNMQSAERLFKNILPHLLTYIRQRVVVQGKNVLVACGAGKSRSVIVIATYLIKYHRMQPKTALEFIKSRRPSINPNPGFLYELYRRFNANG